MTLVIKIMTIMREMMTKIWKNNNTYFFIKNGNKLKMKKNFLILFLILLIIFAGVGGVSFADRLFKFNDCADFKLIVFTYKNYEDLNMVKCGNLNMITMSSFNELNLIEKEDRVSENYYYSKSDFNLDEFLTRSKVVMTENVEGLTLYYIYDSSLTKILKSGGERFNIQVAVSDCQIVLGYPCIMSSY